MLKPRQIVNENFYCEQSDGVKKSLVEKYPVIVKRKDVILQRNNARLRKTNHGKN